MKFLLFALLAAVCLLTVNSGSAYIEPHESELAQMPIEIEAQSKVGKALKTGLRTLKGFNCIIQWVVGIKASAEQYATDIKNCGVETSKQVASLLKANLNIVNTCNDIIHLQSNVCNVEPEEHKITNSCVYKAFGQIFKLYVQTKKVVVMAKKVPKGATDAAGCVVSATNTLTNYYTQFTQNIISCSKLTS